MNYSDIEEAVESINRTKPLSGVVLVQNKDEVIFHQAYGLANRSELIPNIKDTRFGIASGSKIFTAVAICQLVEKGLLSFDTLLRDCLDISFGDFDMDITVHHLLTHSSGMPDYFDEETMDDYAALWNDRPMYRMKSPIDFIPMFTNQKKKFAAGERFHYNNAGFVVLGLIIEQLTGMSFTEYVEKNIFLPCGMVDSGYFSLDRLPGNVAYGYIENEQNGSWKSNIYSIPVIGGPDGGAFVTAADIIRFWKGLFGYKLLSRAYAERLSTVHISAGDNENYGYGIWIEKLEGQVFKYHLMGGDPGVSFRSSVYPSQDIKIVVTSNKAYGGYAVTKAIEARMGKTS